MFVISGKEELARYICTICPDDREMPGFEGVVAKWDRNKHGEWNRNCCLILEQCLVIPGDTFLEIVFWYWAILELLLMIRGQTIFRRAETETFVLICAGSREWQWKYKFWLHWSDMIPKDKWLTRLERYVGEFEPWQRLERQICVLSKVGWAAFQAAYQVARLPAWRVILVIGKDWKGSKCQVDQLAAKLFQQDAEFYKWYGPHLFAMSDVRKC